MFTGKLAVVCLAAALLVVSSTAFAAVADPCNSTATIILSGAPSLPVTLLACPKGDAPTMIEYGWYIALTIQDGAGVGVANIPPWDIWMDDCDPFQDLLIFCGPRSTALNADSLTNLLGQTTMSNTHLAASTLTGSVSGPPAVGTAFCTDGIIIVVQGMVLEDQSTSCTTKMCLPINVRSFDLTGDGIVSPSDLSTFAIGYIGGVGTPNPCIDYDGSGTINPPDLSTFALHYEVADMHRCIP